MVLTCDIPSKYAKRCEVGRYFLGVALGCCSNTRDMYRREVVTAGICTSQVHSRKRRKRNAIMS